MIPECMCRPVHPSACLFSVGGQSEVARRPVAGYRRHHRVDGIDDVRLPESHRPDDRSASVAGTRASGRRRRHARPARHGGLSARADLSRTPEVERAAQRKDGVGGRDEHRRQWRPLERAVDTQRSLDELPPLQLSAQDVQSCDATTRLSFQADDFQ